MEFLESCRNHNLLKLALSLFLIVLFPNHWAMKAYVSRRLFWAFNLLILGIATVSTIPDAMSMYWFLECWGSRNIDLLGIYASPTIFAMSSVVTALTAAPIIILLFFWYSGTWLKRKIEKRLPFLAYMK